MPDEQEDSFPKGDVEFPDFDDAKIAHRSVKSHIYKVKAYWNLKDCTTSALNVKREGVEYNFPEPKEEPNG